MDWTNFGQAGSARHRRFADRAPARPLIEPVEMSAGLAPSSRGRGFRHGRFRPRSSVGRPAQPPTIGPVLARQQPSRYRHIPPPPPPPAIAVSLGRVRSSGVEQAVRPRNEVGTGHVETPAARAGGQPCGHLDRLDERPGRCPIGKAPVARRPRLSNFVQSISGGWTLFSHHSWRGAGHGDKSELAERRWPGTT